MTRVALYARVSTKDKGQDVENQLIQLRAEVEKNPDWELVKVYQDRITGTTDQRPEFQKMMEDAKNKRFDSCLFWSLDRFGRFGVLDTLQYLQTLIRLGVDWKSYTEPYLQSIGPFRDAVIGILATIAQQESIRRSERAHAAYDRLRKQGAWERVGRRKKVFPRGEAQDMAKAGKSLSEMQAALLGRGFKVSRATLSRVRAEMNGAS